MNSSQVKLAHLLLFWSEFLSFSVFLLLKFTGSTTHLPKLTGSAEPVDPVPEEPLLFRVSPSKIDGFLNPSHKIDGFSQTRRTRARGAPAILDDHYKNNSGNFLYTYLFGNVTIENRENSPGSKRKFFRIHMNLGIKLWGRSKVP